MTYDLTCYMDFICLDIFQSCPGLGQRLMFWVFLNQQDREILAESKWLKFFVYT